MYSIYITILYKWMHMEENLTTYIQIEAEVIELFRIKLYHGNSCAAMMRFW